MKVKAYTDIVQSRKLAEILPITTIDFAWNIFNDGSTRLLCMDDWEVFENTESDVEIIPCWSLAALLNVLKDYQLFSNGLIVYIDNDSYRIDSDNPVDACYEIMIRLHEEKLL